MQNDTGKEVVNLQIKYSPAADALIIRLKSGKIVDSEDITDCIIVHYNKNKEPVELEILDASKIVHLDDIDISWKELLSLRQQVLT